MNYFQSLFKNQLFFLLVLVTMSSCQFDSVQSDFDKGEKYLKQKKFKEAFFQYEKVLDSYKGNPSEKLAIRAAQGAAKASYEMKYFDKVLSLYRYIVVHSSSQKEQIFSKERIIHVYFEKLADYKSSLREIHQLLNRGEQRRYLCEIRP